MCVLGRLVCAGAREGSSREASDSSRDGCKGLVGHGTIGSAAIWVQWAVCVSVFSQHIFSTPASYIKMTRVTSANLQGVNLLNLRDNGWIHKWRELSRPGCRFGRSFPWWGAGLRFIFFVICYEMLNNENTNKIEQIIVEEAFLQQNALQESIANFVVPLEFFLIPGHSCVLMPW